MKFIRTAGLLKKTREKKGISQLVIAKKLGYKDSRAISNFERGRATLPLKKINTYRNFLKIPHRQIMAGLVLDYRAHAEKSVKVK